MATLLKGDCLEVMKGLSDKSIDCFICDLPYGQLIPYQANLKLKVDGNPRKSHTACPWDVKLNLEEFWTQVKRLARNDHVPVLMFCNTKFGYDLMKSNEKWFRYDLVWDKSQGVSFLLANKMPMKSHEMIYVFSKKGAAYNRIDISGSYASFAAAEYTHGTNTVAPYSGKIKATGSDGTTRCPLSVINIQRTIKRASHPTEKPLELYKWLIERYVPTNGTLLDPTAGSFNAIIAARSLGFKAIGIEKDPGFFWKAVGKIK